MSGKVLKHKRRVVARRFPKSRPDVPTSPQAEGPAPAPAKTITFLGALDIEAGSTVSISVDLSASPSEIAEAITRANAERAGRAGRGDETLARNLSR
jgi:hypothetical protein